MVGNQVSLAELIKKNILWAAVPYWSKSDDSLTITTRTKVWMWHSDSMDIEIDKHNKDIKYYVYRDFSNRDCDSFCLLEMLTYTYHAFVDEVFSKIRNCSEENGADTRKIYSHSNETK